MKTDQKSKSSKAFKRLASLPLLLLYSCLFMFICGSLAFSAPPTWWTSQQVLDVTKPAEDYAPVNQGQLKALAKKAVEAMNTNLPGGAGEELNNLVATWALPKLGRDDYQVVNVGQVRALVKKFYDRVNELNGVSQTISYPWIAASVPPDDYAVANVGQVKFAFSFPIQAITDADHNGLPDDWETQNFGQTGIDPNADPDGDQLTNLQEFQNGSNPNDFYNGQQPLISIVSGDAQTGVPNEVLFEPLSVEVKNISNQPLSNAPVTFSVVDGGGLLLDALSLASSLTVRTDSAGKVTIQYRQGFDENVTSYIKALASLSSVVFSSQTGTTSNGVLEKILGDNQTWLGGSIAPMPLMIELKETNGVVIGETTIEFSVKSSDAKILKNEESSEEQTTLGVMTNSQGRAWVYLKTATSGDSVIEAKQGSRIVAFTVHSSAEGATIENTKPILWLKADQGVKTNEQNEVTRWIDQSGNGHDAIDYDANKPFLITSNLNNLPTVLFNKNQDGLQIQGNSKLDDFTKGSTVMMVFRSIVGLSYFYKNFLEFSDVSGGNKIQLRNETDDFIQWFWNDQWISYGSNFTEQFVVVSFVQKPDGTIELFKNGVKLTYESISKSLPAVVERVQNYLGKDMNVELSEVYMLNYSLSERARGLVEFNLASKYRITDFLPAPTFDPQGGHYQDLVKVQIQSPYPGVQIYYTLDGTDPTTSSLFFTSGPTFTQDARVRAIAVYSANGSTMISPVAESYYYINDDDEDGLPNDWEIAHGLNPNNSSDASIDIDGDGWTSLQEFKWGTNLIVSDIPTVSLPDGNYSNPILVSLLKNKDTLQIVYTLDGVDPTIFSTVYQEPLTILKSTTIKTASVITEPNGSKFMTNFSTKRYWIGDTDHDGISDAWEIEHGLNPYDPLDAKIDDDHDGLTSYEEYILGSDPTLWDSNNDGIPDGLAHLLGISVTGQIYFKNTSPNPRPVQDTNLERIQITLDEPSNAILIP